MPTVTLEHAQANLPHLPEIRRIESSMAGVTVAQTGSVNVIRPEKTCARPALILVW